MNTELYHVVFAVVYLIRGIVAVEKFAVIFVVGSGDVHRVAIGWNFPRADAYVGIFRQWICVIHCYYRKFLIQI